jgi:hypothetical protein
MQLFVLMRKMKTTRFDIEPNISQLYSEVLMDIDPSPANLIDSWNKYVDHTIDTVRDYLNFSSNFQYMSENDTQLMYTYSNKEGDVVTKCEVTIREFMPWYIGIDLTP